MAVLLPSFLLLLIASVFGRTSGNESLKEELVLKPLANGDVLGHLNFVLLTEEKAFSGDHFNLTPKVVGEFIGEHHLDELHVALTRGVWRTALWGSYPPTPSAPAGAGVTAHFNPEEVDEADVDNAWKKLVNALSGQLCASLNFLGPTNTVSPIWSLRPTGAVNYGQDPQNSTYFKTHLRHGSLPGENVCTENLTPWKKLLPCQSKRGLGTLLNARAIHRTKYHSISLSFRRVCSSPSATSCSEQDGTLKVELSHQVTLIFDPPTFQENRRAIGKNKGRDWSLRSLFGIGLNSRCPLTEDSRIVLQMSEPNSHLMKVEPPSQKVLSKNMYMYNLDDFLERGLHNIHFTHPDLTQFEAVTNERLLRLRLSNAGLLSVVRHQKGYGQERGGLVTKIKNSYNFTVPVVYLDVIPWFLRVYLHTLNIQNSLTGVVEPLDLHFVPGVDRAKPYLLELVLSIPANSETVVSIEFEHSLLKWLEYPPDANKGFYIGATLVSALLPYEKSVFIPSHHINQTFAGKWDSDQKLLLQLYSEPLLINLPTPDFSMPYNVICLACTVIALAIGPLVNITTKVLEIIHSEQDKRSWSAYFKENVSAMLFRSSVKSKDDSVTSGDKGAKEKSE